jgi:endonuclease I
LWTHDIRPITFLLVVDDFRIKYVGAEHAERLKASIEKHFQISCDWTVSAYCGLKLDWDYQNKFADLSMPGYIKAALHKFQHPTPTRPENVPHMWNPPVYGEKNQCIEAQIDNAFLPQKYVTPILQLAGTLL